MTKWDYLIEGNEPLRAAQRNYLSSGNDVDYRNFLGLWLRSGSSAESWGLDPHSRYRRDFDALVDYCRGPLKGVVIPMRGSASRSNPHPQRYVVYSMDFTVPRQVGRVEALQRINITYLEEAFMRRSIESYLSGNSPKLALHNTKGWVRLFDTDTIQPQPWQSIRVNGNKALRAVFDDRIH